KIQEDLTAKTQAAQQFKMAHGIISFQDEKVNLVALTMAKVSEQLTEANLKLISAEANYEAVESLKNDPDKLLDMARADQPTGINVNPERNEPIRDVIDNELLQTSASLRAGINEKARKIDDLLR